MSKWRKVHSETVLVLLVGALEDKDKKVSQFATEGQSIREGGRQKLIAYENHVKNNNIPEI